VASACEDAGRGDARYPEDECDHERQNASPHASLLAPFSSGAWVKASAGSIGRSAIARCLMM
jgi:hypothetical protein